MFRQSPLLLWLLLASLVLLIGSSNNGGVAIGSTLHTDWILNTGGPVNPELIGKRASVAALAVDKQGNSLVVGFSAADKIKVGSSVVGEGRDYVSNNTLYVFPYVMKLSPDGLVMWADKGVNIFNVIIVRAAAQFDHAGNAIVLFRTTTSGPVLLVYDTDGHLIRNGTFPQFSNSSLATYTVTVDNADNIYLAGSYSRPPLYEWRLFIGKLETKSISFEWYHETDASQQSIGISECLIVADSLYMSGYIMNRTSFFDIDLVPSLNYDPFLASFSVVDGSLLSYRDYSDRSTVTRLIHQNTTDTLFFSMLAYNSTFMSIIQMDRRTFNVIRSSYIYILSGSSFSINSLMIDYEDSSMISMVVGIYGDILDECRNFINSSTVYNTGVLSFNLSSSCFSESRILGSSSAYRITSGKVTPMNEMILAGMSSFNVTEWDSKELPFMINTPMIIKLSRRTLVKNTLLILDTDFVSREFVLNDNFDYLIMSDRFINGSELIIESGVTVTMSSNVSLSVLTGSTLSIGSLNGDAVVFQSERKVNPFCGFNIWGELLLANVVLTGGGRCRNSSATITVNSNARLQAEQVISQSTTTRHIHSMNSELISIESSLFQGSSVLAEGQQLVLMVRNVTFANSMLEMVCPGASLIVLEYNTFDSLDAGFSITSFYGRLTVRENTFTNNSVAMNIQYRTTSTISKESVVILSQNSIRQAGVGMKIVFFDGDITISNNSFSNSGQYLLVDAAKAPAKKHTVNVLQNTFASTSLLTTVSPLVRLSSLNEKTIFNFRKNNYSESRTNVQLQISGQVNVAKNFFSFHGGPILKKTDSGSAINAQFNYWGKDSMTQNEVETSVGYATLPAIQNLRVLFLPYMATKDGGDIWGSLFTPIEMVTITDCASIRGVWATAPPGIYQIYPKCVSITVICDFNTSALMVIQRRESGEYDFDRDWQQYVSGFYSEYYNEYFYGLENIYKLSTLADTRLFVEYSENVNASFLGQINYLFRVDSLASNYTLTIGEAYSAGGVSDKLSSLNGSAFSTFDYNDLYGGSNYSHGGWWFNSDNFTDVGQLNGAYASQFTWGSLPLKYSRMSLGFVNASTAKCLLQPKFAIPQQFIVEYCDQWLVLNVTARDLPSLTNYSVKYETAEPVLNQYLSSFQSFSVVIPVSKLHVGYQNITVRLMGNTTTRAIVSTITTVLRKPLILEFKTDQLTVETFSSSETFVFVYVLGLPSCWTNLTRSWSIAGSLLNSTTNSTLAPIPTGLIVGDQLVRIKFIVDGIVFYKDQPVRVFEPVVIDGGNRRIPIDYEITLKTRTTLFSNVDGVYIWDSPNRNSTLIATGNSVVFSANSTGNYTVAVSYIVNKKYPGRVTTYSVNIEVVPWKYLPVVAISTAGLSNIISSQKKLKLEASLAPNVNVSNIVYEWIIVNEDTGVSTSMGKGRMRLPLILPENQLLPITSYTIMFRARDMQYFYEGYASVSFRTSSIPLITSFITTPTAGSELFTLFNFTVTANDTDSKKLRYSFYIVNLDGTIDPLQLKLDSFQFSSFLPRRNSSDLLSIKVVVENEYGSKSESVNNLTVTENNKSMDLLLDFLVNPPVTTDVQPIINIAVNVIHQKGSSMSEPVLQSFISNTTQLLSDALSKNSSSVVYAAVSNIHVLSQYSNNMTNSVRETASSIIGTIMDIVIASKSTYSAIQLDDSELQQLASSISNVRPNNDTQHSATNQLSQIQKLGTIIATDKLAAEPLTALKTDNFELLIQVDIPEYMKDSRYNSTSGNVGLPASIEALNSNQTYTIEMISFGAVSNPYSWSNSTQNITASVISFRLLSNNKKESLRNMSEPIEIIMKKDQSIAIDSKFKHRYSCRYWDEVTQDSWLNDGCVLYKETVSEIICHCNHTTSFSAFIIYDPKDPNKASAGLYIAYIVVYSGFVVLSLCVLVGVSIWNKKQPIRSRFIAPFIGLIAIIIECILNGIIRNGLLIGATSAKDYRGVNSIAYIIMSIVNPIVLVSLFVYFWQMMRYLFMKNLYAIMDVERANHRKLRFLKMISSKVLYLVLSIGIMLLTATYFVLISILEATSVIRPNAASAFNALSFSTMTFAIAVLIVGLFLWDLSIVLTRKVYKRSADYGKESVEGKSVELERAVGGFRIITKHFTSDDPLQFRIESLFMVLGLVVMLISYIVGISDRFNPNSTENSGAKIVEFLFDIAYILIRLVSFGGYAVVVRLWHRFRFHQQHEEYTALKSYVSDLKSGISPIEQRLLTLLRHEYGYETFAQYAKKEFALENLLLWKDLEIIRSENMVMSTEERLQSIKRTYDLYIARGSDFEINIPAKCRNMIARLQENDQILAAEAEEILLMLNNEIMVNICDTFTRFNSTEEYHRYMHLSNLSVQLMDVDDKKKKE